jgi:hypothetical protein
VLFNIYYHIKLKMVHVKFDPNSISMAEFEIQSGGSDYNYFRGSLPFQRGFGYQTGAGVGDFLRTLWRAILPSIKSVGKAVGQEALSTGSRVFDNVVQGENLKESLKKEGIKGVDNLLEKGRIGRQYGTGSIKTLKIHRHKIIPFKKGIFNKNSKQIKKLVTKKRKREDAFGLY